MTVASADINFQRKHVICHVAKVEPATSAHSMADVIPFLVYSNNFESNASIQPNENIFYTNTKKKQYP